MSAFLSKPDQIAERAKVLATPVATLAHVDVVETAYVDLTVTFEAEGGTQAEPAPPVRAPTVRVYLAPKVDS